MVCVILQHRQVIRNVMYTRISTWRDLPEPKRVKDPLTTTYAILVIKPNECSRK